MVNTPRDFDSDILNRLSRYSYENFNTLYRKLKMNPSKLREKLNFLTKNGIIKEHDDPKGDLTGTPNSKYYEVISDLEIKPIALIRTYQRIFDDIIKEMYDLAKQLEKKENRINSSVKISKIKTPYLIADKNLGTKKEKTGYQIGTMISNKPNKKGMAIFEKLCNTINRAFTKSQGLTYAQVLDIIPKKHQDKLNEIQKNLIIQIRKIIKQVIKSQKNKAHMTSTESQFRFKVFGYMEMMNVSMYLKTPNVRW